MVVIKLSLPSVHETSVWRLTTNKLKRWNHHSPPRTEPSSLTKHNFKSARNHSSPALNRTMDDWFQISSDISATEQHLNLTYLAISNNNFTNRLPGHGAFRIFSGMAVIKLRLSNDNEKFTVTIDCHRIYERKSSIAVETEPSSLPKRNSSLCKKPRLTPPPLKWWKIGD